MGNINNYYGIGFNNIPNANIEDERQQVQLLISYMLLRTRRMFKYVGLPETIPERVLELNLQTYGNVCITHVNDNLYCLTGNFGGEPNANYMPTIYTVANPYLKFNANLRINEDCIIIPSDSLYIGLYPLCSKYAQLIAKSETTLRVNNIVSRIPYAIVAPDDSTKASAELFLKDLQKGNIGIMGDRSILDDLKTIPFGAGAGVTRLTDLIEYNQYLKGSWLNEIGLASATNMKRESLNDDETHLNDDILLPLVNDMLECRKDGVEKVNQMYGTNISVELNSAWENREQAIEAEQERQETEIDGKQETSEVERDSETV